jgi:hypothetical protein
MLCPGIPPLLYNLVLRKEKQKIILQIICSNLFVSIFFPSFTTGGTFALQVLCISPALSAFGSYGS